MSIRRVPGRSPALILALLLTIFLLPSPVEARDRSAGRPSAVPTSQPPPAPATLLPKPQDEIDS